MINLKYCLITAHIECNENRHPQEVMRELGIKYQHATPQSVCDQWWFWNCEGVPAQLPEYLSEMSITPHEAIGYGLSRAMAESIVLVSEGKRDE